MIKNWVMTKLINKKKNGKIISSIPLIPNVKL